MTRALRPLTAFSNWEKILLLSDPRVEISYCIFKLEENSIIAIPGSWDLRLYFQTERKFNYWVTRALRSLTAFSNWEKTLLFFSDPGIESSDCIFKLGEYSIAEWPGGWDLWLHFQTGRKLYYFLVTQALRSLTAFSNWENILLLSDPGVEISGCIFKLEENSITEWPGRWDLCRGTCFFLLGVWGEKMNLKSTWG